MANDFIKLNRASAPAVFVNDLVNLPRELRAWVDKAEKIRDMGYRMFVADPVDFSAFETNYGIPTGSGQAVFDLINGTLGALAGTMQNANAEELMNRVG